MLSFCRGPRLISFVYDLFNLERNCKKEWLYSGRTGRPESSIRAVNR